MECEVDYNKAKVIVELGAGTGVFTDEIVKRLNPNTTLIVLEINPLFCKLLQEKYDNLPNVIVIDERAENLGLLLEKMHILDIDYVISGLPLLCISKECRYKIFATIAKYLKGSLIFYQYTGFLESEINLFYHIDRKEKIYLNIPQYYH